MLVIIISFAAALGLFLILFCTGLELPVVYDPGGSSVRGTGHAAAAGEENREDPDLFAEKRGEAPREAGRGGRGLRQTLQSRGQDRGSVPAVGRAGTGENCGETSAIIWYRIRRKSGGATLYRLLSGDGGKYSGTLLQLPGYAAEHCGDEGTGEKDLRDRERAQGRLCSAV